MMLQQVLMKWLKMLNYHCSLEIFKKKTTTNNYLKRMFSHETEGQPLDDLKEK